jgi:hypothetical protein
MMDCRQALQILEFDLPDADGLPEEICSAEEHAAALAHLESCPVCVRTVGNRRELDRTIGRVMRTVAIPRGAQQRLLAQIAELEATGTIASTTANDHSSRDANDGIAAGPGQLPAVDGEVPAITPAKPLGRPTRRRFLKSLVPLTTCVAVALAGFFGVVWYFSPRWSVADVSQSLTEIDFASLQALPDCTGGGKAAQLPRQAGWEHLKWQCGKQAKGLPLAANAIAVYGFEYEFDGRPRQSEPIQGLIAVIPRNQVRDAPAETSLAAAVPTSGYLTARIGESVCVAWQEGDYVYVCLVRGGPDSLSRLQQALEQPAA